MKRFAASLLALLLFCTPALAKKPKVGDVLPDLTIKAAPKPAEAAYLGLPDGTQSFRLSQIKAEVLLVELFSMYCPHCQAEAKPLGRVFERLMALPQSKALKFLGIGAGNSAYEVDTFRLLYEIPMPLFQDGDYELLKAFGTTSTPTYLMLRPTADGRGLKVLFVQEGRFEDEQTFLELILRASGVQ